MDILFTLDYEFFFGPRIGDFKHTLHRPTDLLLDIFHTYDVKATFFVDVGFIKRSLELGVDSNNRNQYIDHLNGLIERGHDLQLHIHPHWEDSVYENGQWVIDFTRYRLHDYSKNDAANIVKNYSNLLNSTFSIQAKAYRAGGWCLQPFSHISSALADAGIILDSTVFSNGKNNNSVNSFDFRNSPKSAYWRFDEDPLKSIGNGRFTELPIASLRVSPFFYWKLAISQKFGGNIHKTFGDGVHVKVSRSSLLKLLLLPSSTVVSIDGYKASLLQGAYADVDDRYDCKDPMVIIGHPKSLTPYSLQCIERFLTKIHDSNTCISVATWIEKWKT